MTTQGLKTRCQTRDLLEAVNLVSGVVSSHSTRPILQSLLLEAEAGGGLVVRGTDLEVGLSIRVDEVEVETAGTTVVSASRLHAILREAKADVTELEDTPDKNTLQIQSGNSRFKVSTSPVEEFPKVDFNPPDSSFMTDREVFQRMLQRTSVAAARDATRFQMHSVLLDCRDGALRLVSTDGKRMSLCEETLGEGGLSDGQYIVPLKGVELLNRILASEQSESIKIHLDQNEITYSSDRISLSCRLVEGRYPEYERALPEAGEIMYDFGTDDMLVALRQASVMTTKETNSVLFSFSGNELVITASAGNIGESRIEVGVEPVEGEGAEFSISFNPTYVIDLFKTAGAPRLRGRFKDRKTAGLFFLSDDEQPYRHVIMPLVANE